MHSAGILLRYAPRVVGQSHRSNEQSIGKQNRIELGSYPAMSRDVRRDFIKALSWSMFPFQGPFLGFLVWRCQGQQANEPKSG